MDLRYYQVRLHSSSFASKKGTARELKEYLANEHNILIRDASNFAGLDESYARITSRDEASNNKLVAGISTWLQQQ